MLTQRREEKRVGKRGSTQERKRETERERVHTRRRERDRETESAHTRERERQRVHARRRERERDPRPFGSSFYVFSSPGPAYVNWASQEALLSKYLIQFYRPLSPPVIWLEAKLW